MKRFWRRSLWIVGGLAVLAIALLLIGWLTFQHIPSWYQPPRIPLAELQRVRDDFLAAGESFSTALNEAGRPFRFKVTQDQVNAWLVARDTIDPQSGLVLPPELSDPMVVFERDGIRVAATYDGGSVHTVISAKLAISADVQGISARLEDIAGGSLSLPDALIRQLLEEVDRRVSSAALQRAGVISAGQSPPRLADLLQGVTLPNTGRLPAGGQRFRLVDLELEPGAAILTIERLPPQPSRR